MSEPIRPKTNDSAQSAERADPTSVRAEPASPIPAVQSERVPVEASSANRTETSTPSGPPDGGPSSTEVLATSPSNQALIRSLTSVANRVRQVGVGQLLVLIATLGTALTTWFQFGEMSTQTELTRQTIAATERSLRITEEALRATRDSNDIARRAASAAGQQAGLAQRQLDQGNAQIDVGRDANHLSAEAARMERRAWLTVKTVTLVRLLTGAPAVAQLHIENSGSTPALETEIASVVVGRVRLMEEDFRAPHIGPRVSKMVVGPDTVITVFAETSEPVSAGYMQTYQAGGTRLFAMGHIYYKDVFGKSHETEFCFSVSAREMAQQVNRVPVSTAPQNLVPLQISLAACSTNNSAR